MIITTPSVVRACGSCGYRPPYDSRGNYAQFMIDRARQVLSPVVTRFFDCFKQLSDIAHNLQSVAAHRQKWNTLLPALEQQVSRRDGHASIKSIETGA